MAALPDDFYVRPNVTEIAKELIGMVLYSNVGGCITAGKIVEVEAYSGTNDKACHANENKRTPRTEIMFQKGGLAYVYLCYGMHRLFNVVTNVEGMADAVLIRALEPLEGIEYMLQRSNKNTLKGITSGPAKLSVAMGIQLRHYGARLNEGELWIEYEGFKPSGIIETTRIGVDYAGLDALKPWRFYEQGNSWVSKP